jgi:hypothetical protein
MTTFGKFFHAELHYYCRQLQVSLDRTSLFRSADLEHFRPRDTRNYIYLLLWYKYIVITTVTITTMTMTMTMMMMIIIINLRAIAPRRPSPQPSSAPRQGRTQGHCPIRVLRGLFVAARQNIVLCELCTTPVHRYDYIYHNIMFCRDARAYLWILFYMVQLFICYNKLYHSCAYRPVRDAARIKRTCDEKYAYDIAWVAKPRFAS